MTIIGNASTRGTGNGTRAGTVAALARAVALGAASGSRSSAAITALALTSRPGDRGVIASRAGSPRGKAVTALLAAGELAADKLPAVPSRLGAPGIVPRAALAAAAAAGMTARDGGRPAPSAAGGQDSTAAGGQDSTAAAGGQDSTAAAGGQDSSAAVVAVCAVAALTALGSAVLGARLRALAARRLGWDLPGALAEDALAGTLAWLGTRRR